jgi:hypothetical protein
MSEICARVAEGIIAIDTEFVRRRTDASHLVVDAFVRIARTVADAPDKAERMTPMLFDHLSARLATRGFMGDAAEQHAVLHSDIALNSSGLTLWLARRRA